MDRGCKEGETSSHVYKLTFDNIDTEHYEYLRLYALERTSNNGTPVTRLVTSIQTKLLQQNKSIIDNGI